MPILSLVTSSPFEDGRQSDRALSVRNGVERYLAELGHACLPELSLRGGRRADIVSLCAKGTVTIVEIKSSIADFRADRKWPDYLDWCDAFWFATLPDVPEEIFPDEAGLLIADGYGAHIVREPVEARLNAARRKQMHLRFARASALRLARCCEHAGMSACDFEDEASG